MEIGIKAQNKIFKILSLVMHPVFIPTYITFVYLKIFDGVLIDDIAEYLISLVVIGTLVLPLFTVLLLRATNVIDSIFLENNRQRLIPVLSSGIYIYITARLLMNGSVNSPLNSYLIGVVVSLSWVLIFSRRMKVSLHTASLSSAIGFLIYLSKKFIIDLSPIIVVLIVVLGLIATARLKLKSHSESEIIAGMIFGLIPQLGYLFLY